MAMHTATTHRTTPMTSPPWASEGQRCGGQDQEHGLKRRDHNVRGECDHGVDAAPYGQQQGKHC